MVTRLAIQPLDTGDCRFMRFVDNSFYNPDITVENAILEITPPGAGCPVYFYTQKDFNTVFNSSTLDILPTNSYNGLVSLPDGLYRLKYSIKPNDKIYETFDHMRTCQITQRWQKAFCEFMAARYDISKKVFKEKFEHYMWIKQLIESSKHKVEICDNYDEGIELYNEAKDLLDKFC